MGVLALASVWSWILIGEGIFSVSRLKRALRQAAVGKVPPLFLPIATAGRAASLIEIPNESVGEMRLRIAEAMGRTAHDLVVQAERSLPILAVIASIAPFVGLFGTVYGIMTSFANIAEAQDTSLAVVAPGIAEALAATAWGLAAAIPASAAYNRLGASLMRASQKLSHFIDERAVSFVTAGPPISAKEAA
jgi:biopolymer transport protein ExbB/TolQ